MLRRCTFVLLARHLNCFLPLISPGYPSSSLGWHRPACIVFWRLSLRPVRCVRRHPHEDTSLMELGETICPYCGVGCRLRLEGSGGQVTKVRGVEEAAANLGRLCAKGAQLGPTIDTPDRLKRPQLRLGRQDNFRSVDWDTALSYTAEIFTNILHAHG